MDGRIISEQLWGAMKIADMVRERINSEGPTTLALELVSSHPDLLRSIDDAELIRVTALLQSLERGKLFLIAASQVAEEQPERAGEHPGSLLGVHPSSRANPAPFDAAGETVEQD